MQRGICDCCGSAGNMWLGPAGLKPQGWGCERIVAELRGEVLLPGSAPLNLCGGDAGCAVQYGARLNLTRICGWAR